MRYTTGLVLATFGTLAVASAAQAAYLPIAVSGFGNDVILASTDSYSTGLTATMDDGTGKTGNTFYEAGYVATGGLPAGGLIVSAVDAGHTFQLQSYTANNALMIAIPFDSYGAHTTNQPIGTLTVNQPASYSALSFLVASGSGAGAVGYTINYAAGAAATGTLAVPNWGDVAAGMAVKSGRANSSGFDNADYGMFQVDVTGLTNTSAITSIDFVNDSLMGNKTIFAVSGAVPEPTSMAVLGLGGLSLLARRRR